MFSKFVWFFGVVLQGGSGDERELGKKVAKVLEPKRYVERIDQTDMYK